jgi:hypothetical protein
MAELNTWCRLDWVILLNPACGGTLFTVWCILAEIINFCDFIRGAAARALGHARALAISMARGGHRKRT